MHVYNGHIQEAQIHQIFWLGLRSLRANRGHNPNVIDPKLLNTVQESAIMAK